MANYDKSLTAEHISSNLSAYEAARSSYFTFVIDDLDDIVKANYTGLRENAGAKDRFANAQEYIKLNVTKSAVPNFKMGKLSYDRGNEKINFAGKPEWDGGSFTVDDVVGLNTKEILLAWRALVYDTKTRKVGKMVDYKKDCTLCEYTQDYQLIRSWKMYGCWPSYIDEAEFDRSAEDKRELKITLEYDRAELL